MARKQRRRRGVLHVFARGGQWWAQVPGCGRRSLSLPIENLTRDDAYRIAAQRFAAGGLDTRAAASCREGRLTELAAMFITENRGRWSSRHRANVAYQLAAFTDAVGVSRIEQITAETLSRYVDRRHAEGVTDATVNRCIQVARAMARWAAHRSPPLCDEGALAKWKNLREIARNRDPLIPSPEEWGLVIGELERDPAAGRTPRLDAIVRSNARGMALLVACAVQTGLRIDELRHLRAEDIGADVVRVRAWGTWRPKDREERDVPAPAVVAALAAEFVRWHATTRGLSGKLLALGPNWIAERLVAAWSRTNIPGDAPGMHDCRRTFATEMSRRPGVSIRDVQRLLGHADLVTTQRYLGRYRSDDARPAVDMGLAGVLTRVPAVVIPMRRL